MKHKIQLKLLNRIKFVIKQIRKQLKKLNLRRFKNTAFSELELEDLAKLLLLDAVKRTKIIEIVNEIDFVVGEIVVERVVEIDKLLKIMNKKMEEHLIDLARVIRGETKQEFDRKIKGIEEPVDEGEDNVADDEWVSDQEQPMELPERKNRRGQRARRA
jgi:uncharacterized protein YfkK (UPF0435 family)